MYPPVFPKPALSSVSQISIIHLRKIDEKKDDETYPRTSATLSTLAGIILLWAAAFSKTLDEALVAVAAERVSVLFFIAPVNSVAIAVNRKTQIDLLRPTLQRVLNIGGEKTQMLSQSSV
jgi:hypothetical protein